MKTLIKNLVESFGPSGYEDNIRTLIKKEIHTVCDDIYVDPLGNLIAKKGSSSPKGLRVMLSAHMDEIGVMVTHIEEAGFVRFTSIGGVNPLTCVGGRVIFENGTRGVIACERLSDRKIPSMAQLFIDVGATNKEDCTVKIGDPGIFDRFFLDLGNRLVSKAMDDRIAAAILIETLHQIKSTPHELYFVFSVQEEVGLRGAFTSAYGINPELGISVDVTSTGDTPKAQKMAVKLGDGPAIKIRDGRMISDPTIVRIMQETAERAHIPFQLEVLLGGTTDAAAIQTTRAGVPVGCISIPCRYVHHPSEMVDYNDVQNAVHLLVELLSHPIVL
ncbi:MAG: M42 family metallopeptidase [Anaerolineaceae bacterium]|nr:M42 family metallopeptidase [Anaerolineaceae bacterium]